MKNFLITSKSLVRAQPGPQNPQNF
jgi:hypothetical protein